MEDITVKTEFVQEQPTGFHLSKHFSKLALANELLTANTDPATELQDYLHCGKLGRLINYLYRGGSVVMAGLAIAENLAPFA